MTDLEMKKCEELTQEAIKYCKIAKEKFNQN